MGKVIIFDQGLLGDVEKIEANCKRFFCKALDVVADQLTIDRLTDDKKSEILSYDMFVDVLARPVDPNEIKGTITAFKIVAEEFLDVSGDHPYLEGSAKALVELDADEYNIIPSDVVSFINEIDEQAERYHYGSHDGRICDIAFSAIGNVSFLNAGLGRISGLNFVCVHSHDEIYQKTIQKFLQEQYGDSCEALFVTDDAGTAIMFENEGVKSVVFSGDFDALKKTIGEFLYDDDYIPRENVTMPDLGPKFE